MSQIVRANEVRSTGPTWDQWPASHPTIAYVTADGQFLCVTCANGGNGSIASTTSEDRQWRIIGAQTLPDRPADDRHCAHCGRIIPASECKIKQWS